MSIDNITEKILNEASGEAELILSKAREDSYSVMQKAKTEAESLMKDAEKRGEADAGLLKSRKVSVADLEARKMRLAAKQQAIAKCFDLALEKLASMSEDDYTELLLKAVAETGVDEGELILNAVDREKVGKKVVKSVNAAKDKDKENGKITLSDETINAKGGFVLKHGSVEINSTLETMVNAVKESATPQVVEALF